MIEFAAVKSVPMMSRLRSVSLPVRDPQSLHHRGEKSYPPHSFTALHILLLQTTPKVTS